METKIVITNESGKSRVYLLPTAKLKALPPNSVLGSAAREVESKHEYVREDPARFAHIAHWIQFGVLDPTSKDLEAILREFSSFKLQPWPVVVAVKLWRPPMWDRALTFLVDALPPMVVHKYTQNHATTCAVQSSGPSYFDLFFKTRKNRAFYFPAFPAGNQVYFNESCTKLGALRQNISQGLGAVFVKILSGISRARKEAIPAEAADYYQRASAAGTSAPYSNLPTSTAPRSIEMTAPSSNSALLNHLPQPSSAGAVSKTPLHLGSLLTPVLRQPEVKTPSCSTGHECNDKRTAYDLETNRESLEAVVAEFQAVLPHLHRLFCMPEFVSQLQAEYAKHGFIATVSKCEVNCHDQESKAFTPTGMTCDFPVRHKFFACRHFFDHTPSPKDKVPNAWAQAPAHLLRYRKLEVTWPAAMLPSNAI